MIRSMTAFARREWQSGEGKLVWEIRSVNHRYLDIRVHLPEELRSLEPALRERLGRRLGRGKIECTLRYRPSIDAANALRINWPYAEQVIAGCLSLGRLLPQAAPISPLELLRLPGVLREGESDLQPVAEAALELLEVALGELLSMREREGERLAAMLHERAGQIRELTREVQYRRPTVVRAAQERLCARIEAFKASADPARLEQELVLIAQRLDVDEELERLLSHIEEVEQVLRQNEPKGRRLDFLMQELNREANTLASKSSDTATTRAAVTIKVLIDQMREQVQNIE
ncbi:MAG: YicC family protein [Nitrococcus mobilis]|nr:YicC family protein [Nitrococcus mobilis]